MTKEESLQKVRLLVDYSIAINSENRSTWHYDNFQENNSVYYYNNAKWLTKEINAYSYKGFYSMFGVGLESDFFAKIKQKRIYLFTASAHFRQGLKMMGYSSEVTTIDDSGETLAFINELTTKGSGIYFQVSRNFQIHPWKIRD